jgi:hypothetical protein
MERRTPPVMSREKTPQNQRDCAPGRLVCQAKYILLVGVAFPGAADAPLHGLCTPHPKPGATYFAGTEVVSESGVLGGADGVDLACAELSCGAGATAVELLSADFCCDAAEA